MGKERLWNNRNISFILGLFVLGLVMGAGTQEGTVYAEAAEEERQLSETAAAESPPF